MESNATDKAVPREITALLSDEQLVLRETQRAATPFGGVAVFISFLKKIGFAEAVRQHMPMVWRSPNHIDPTIAFTVFLVWCGMQIAQYRWPNVGQDRILPAGS